MPAGRTVIVGGGFGGLEAAFFLREFSGRDHEITLLDRNARHSFVPSIHEIISGRVRPGDIGIPFEPLLGHAGVIFLRKTVIDLDLVKRKVICNEKELPFDYLVLGCGAAQKFDIPGAERFALSFRTPEDAGRVRKVLLRMSTGQKFPLSIIIIGGGTEGVEVAGEIIDFFRTEGMEDYLGSGEVKVELIEKKAGLLPGFPPQVGKFAKDYLSGMGVRVMTGKAITQIDRDWIILDSGDRIRSSAVIWTAGIQPSGLIRKLPLKKDPAGWLTVTDKLNSPDDDRIFGTGDIITIYENEKILPIPRVAYNAVDQGRTAGLNISLYLKGKQPRRYTPRLRPQLISLGRQMGILAGEGGFKSGRWVITLKKTVERRYLMSYLGRGLILPVASRIYGFNLLRRLIF